MQCSACSHDNPREARFCLECGQELVCACVSCHEPLPPTAKFCMHCGARQEDATPAPEPPAVVDDAERRLLTVLFCDLVESTRLSRELDPEELREVIREYQRVVVAIIQRHDGHVAQYLGDGILAYFGYPTAHEDDEARAVRAGLSITAEVEKLGTGAERDETVHAEVRVGIDTGRVVIGEVGAGGRHDRLAIGAIPNVAARLQTAARPGQVIAGETTYKRARHVAEFEAVLVAAKGVDGAVPAHRAVSLKSVAGSRHVTSDGLQSDLIGRGDLLERLVSAIQGAGRGVGRVMTVVGEAGVGKSRLLAEARASIDAETFTWLRGRCHDRSIPAHYGPFADILSGYCGISDDDTPAVRRGRVTDCIDGLVANGQLSEERASDCVSLIARALAIDVNGQAEDLLAFADGAQVRHQTFAAIADMLIALTTWRPLVVELDDLHWADSASLDLIAHLSERAPSHPLALVCVYRPQHGHGCERLPEIAARKCPGRHVHVAVRELTPEDGENLVASLLGVDAAPAALRETVVDRARGNPFYIEEALRALVESESIVRDGDGWVVAESLDRIAVPDSVERITLSRLDRMSPDARRLLQIAAVIGRSFARRVLERVAPPHIDLPATLQELEDSAFVTREYGSWDVQYAFRHVYTQQVVYGAVLSRRRQELHGAIAEAIAELYPDAAAEQAETLAYHYTHTEHGARAVEHLMNAGAKARAAYLTDEAVECYHKALQTLDHLPDSPGNELHRVRVHQALGRIHHGAGQGDAAVEHLRAAIDIGERIGVDAGDMIRLCYWLADVHWWKSDYARLGEIGEMAEALLGDERNTVEEALVNQIIATAAYFTGARDRWRERLTRTTAFLRDLPYCEELRPSYVHIWGMCYSERDMAGARDWLAALLHVGSEHHDARATAQAHKGIGDLAKYEGDLEGALAKYETALALFEEIGDTNHAGDCLIDLGALTLSMGRLDDAKRYGGLGLAAAEQIEGVWLRAVSYLSVGELYVCLGDLSVASHSLSRAVELYAETHQKPARPLAVLGWAHLHEGDLDAAARYFDDAATRSTRLFGNAMSGLEETYSDSPEVFPLLCKDLEDSGAAPPEGQWRLRDATPWEFPNVLERVDFIALRPGASLGDAWQWVNVFDDAAYRVENMLDIHAPNGRDLAGMNTSAPRLIRPVDGDFAADAVSLPASDGHPTIGGIVLWVDAGNFLRVERGVHGRHEISFSGRIDAADTFFGRGRVVADRVHLRIERRGDTARALCSIDGRAWSSIGETPFAVDGAMRVGVHALGRIDRTIYRGEFREGAAIRFESFTLRA
ncbi:AAA family ATPase [Candidatus Poribacteria bacterium]|jgi:class 3 adenylate cyclase/tetratricopeptide (TPR) repeat protein|nr:AAA family ATPase [Candidatus Poribacteria bacterium]MBT5711799.1 AAA family ATPase [Candidatus Poribacteria bacterium]MBT7097226.1 AAA family ATPase [Candidatus Poribacteria bacterium]